MDSMASDIEVSETQECIGVIVEEGIYEVEDISLTLLQLASINVSKI
jgi:hypothetical protein